jgi:MFS family permease
VARSGLFNVDAQRGLFSANTNSRYVWFVLGLTVIVQTVGSVVSQGIYTLVPFFRDEFGLNRSEAALAVTVMNAGQVVSMFWLGQATDRYGERAVVSSTMIGMGAAAVMGATLANSYVALLMALFSLGIFYASVQPGGTRAIVRWFPPQHRGLATGLRQAAVPLGTSIAAFTLPLIATAAGWRYAVLAQGLIGVAGGIFFWSCYRESMDLKDGAATVRLPVRALIKTLSEDAGFWLVLGGGVAMSAFQFTFTASAISFMTDHFKMDVLFAASLFAGAQIVGIPGRVLLPFVADRLWPGYRERVLGYIMSICVFVTVAYMLLPPDTPNWALCIVLGIIGLFGIGWFPLYILQIAEIAPKAAIASTVSFGNTLCMIAMSLSPLLFGALADIAGYRIAWLALILPLAILSPMLIRLQRRLPS